MALPPFYLRAGERKWIFPLADPVPNLINCIKFPINLRIRNPTPPSENLMVDILLACPICPGGDSGLKAVLKNLA
jgi:hypothetical protein